MNKNEKPFIEGPASKEIRYLLHEELISSNYSTISLAEDTQAIPKSDDRLVILKRLHWDRFPGEKYKLYDEIRFQRLMKGHPQVGQIKDSWEDGKDIILVLEYAHRGDLHKFMWQHREEMTEQRIEKILYQVLLALKELHERGIMHRDIKPENILLDKNLDARVVDFGWAGEVGNTMTNSEGAGTLTYMSPECLLRAPQNPATDIWSFGVLAYELYHYKEAFPAKNQEEAIKLVDKSPPKFNPQLCPELAQDLIKSCLMYRSHQRPKAKELLQHPLFARLRRPTPVPVIVTAITDAPESAVNAEPSLIKNSVEKTTTTPISHVDNRFLPGFGVLKHYRSNAKSIIDSASVNSTNILAERRPPQTEEKSVSVEKRVPYNPLTGGRSISREFMLHTAARQANEYGLKAIHPHDYLDEKVKINPVAIQPNKIVNFQKFLTERIQPSTWMNRESTGESSKLSRFPKPKLELRKRLGVETSQPTESSVLNMSQPGERSMLNQHLNISDVSQPSQNHPAIEVHQQQASNASTSRPLLSAQDNRLNPEPDNSPSSEFIRKHADNTLMREQTLLITSSVNNLHLVQRHQPFYGTMQRTYAVPTHHENRGLQRLSINLDERWMMTQTLGNLKLRGDLESMTESRIPIDIGKRSNNFQQSMTFTTGTTFKPTTRVIFQPQQTVMCQQFPKYIETGRFVA
jgi:serine/threonine protein kinase